MSEISVHSSASQQDSQISKAPSIAFSDLSKCDDEGINNALKVLGINVDKVAGIPFDVSRLFTPERDIPFDLLESAYQALLNTLIGQGFPEPKTNEAERSMLLYCVLKVSLAIKM